MAAPANDQARALRAVTARHYVIALSDFDSRDWERPGVGAIVRAATPPGRRRRHRR